VRVEEKAEAKASVVDFVDVYEHSAYILGVYDTSSVLYNIPGGVNAAQIIAVVSKYLKNHPEEWNKPAAELVVKALKEAFPKK
jgi:hypothetical protein